MYMLVDLRIRMKEGIGVQFELIEDKRQVWIWRYYQGEWNLDMPNGMGKTVEVD